MQLLSSRSNKSIYSNFTPLSSNAMPVHIEEAIKAGCFRYLTEPFKIQEVMLAIDDALQWSGQGREAAIG